MKSGTSLMNETSVTAFTTLRVAGDRLKPKDVTSILGMLPTASFTKGEKYATGKSKEIVAKTGIWLFDSSKVLFDQNFDNHLSLILHLLGVSQFTGNKIYFDKKLLVFKDFLLEESFSSVLTCFWHGSHQAEIPELPKNLAPFLSEFAVKTELDFDRDEELEGRKRPRVATG